MGFYGCFYLNGAAGEYRYLVFKRGQVCFLEINLTLLLCMAKARKLAESTKVVSFPGGDWSVGDPRLPWWWNSPAHIHLDRAGTSHGLCRDRCDL